MSRCRMPVAAAALVLAALAVLGGWAGPGAPLPAAFAQETASTRGPFAGFKHDSSAPIEIVSDALEVREAEKLAIFSGNVVAKQGTLTLTADRLEVAYGAAGGGATGQIRSMRASGNVFLSNGSETAKAEWAEYDVAEGVIRMGGSVVLTQGENAVAGERLVIDLTAGTGRVEGGGGGRVKSVFRPAAGSGGN